MSARRNQSAHTAEGIFQRMESDIARGLYKPDQLLPSIRDLAGELQVSPATVAAAFRRLTERGLTYVERGVGTKVRNEGLLSETLSHSIPTTLNGSTDVASGSPDPGLLPDLNTHLRRIRVATSLYNVEPMLPAIRDQAAFVMTDVLQGRPPHLTIASGALDSITDALEVRLRPGDRVIVEDPGFAAAFSLLRSHTLTLVPVPIDEQGFKVAPFAEALRHGAKAVLYNPRAQNPYGSALTAQRAVTLRELLTEAHRKGGPVFVIENDHASLVSDDKYHSLTHNTDVWLSTRSLSKSHGPDLRFAFVTGDALTIERMRRRQALNRGWISTIMQHLVVDLLVDPEVHRGTQLATEMYRKRRTDLIKALDRVGVDAHGRSGLNVLVPVDDEGSVSSALLARGWHVRSGQTYRHKSAPFIRVTPSALTDPQIEALADDIAQTLRADAPVLR